MSTLWNKKIEAMSVLYERLEVNSKITIESICQSSFMRKTKEAWAFLVDMAEKIIQWENINEKPTTSRSGIHAIDTSIDVKAKLVAILRRLDSLELKDKAQMNLVSSPTCTNYQAPTHIMEKCPLLGNQVGKDLSK